MAKIAGVYTITCTVTGRQYVGATADAGNRWYKHQSDLRRGVHGNIALQRDWDEHGESAFVFTVAREEPDAAVRRVVEQSLITALDALGIGYNLSNNSQSVTLALGPLKQGGRNRGRPKSASHRARLSAAAQARWDAEERTPELSERMAGLGRLGKGRPKSEETRRKMSEAQRGRQFTEEHLAAVREAHKGLRPTAKLTAGQASEIKRRLAEGATLAGLGREFGVSSLTISDIKHGRTWRDVT